jgi:hypothetical protein
MKNIGFMTGIALTAGLITACKDKKALVHDITPQEQVVYIQQTVSNHYRKSSVSSIEKPVLSIFFNLYSIQLDICFVKTVENARNNFKDVHRRRLLPVVLSACCAKRHCSPEKSNRESGC